LNNLIWDVPVWSESGVGIQLSICKSVLYSGDGALVVSYESIWTSKDILAEMNKWWRNGRIDNILYPLD
jgi:hypothetical protein